MVCAAASANASASAASSADTWPIPPQPDCPSPSAISCSFSCSNDTGCGVTGRPSRSSHSSASTGIASGPTAVWDISTSSLFLSSNQKFTLMSVAISISVPQGSNRKCPPIICPSSCRNASLTCASDKRGMVSASIHISNTLSTGCHSVHANVPSICVLGALRRTMPEFANVSKSGPASCSSRRSAASSFILVEVHIRSPRT